MQKLPKSLYRYTYQHEGMWNSVVNVVLPLLAVLIVIITRLWAQ